MLTLTLCYLLRAMASFSNFLHSAIYKYLSLHGIEQSPQSEASASFAMMTIASHSGNLGRSGGKWSNLVDHIENDLIVLCFGQDQTGCATRHATGQSFSL
jgi:hypothetical protein